MLRDVVALHAMRSYVLTKMLLNLDKPTRRAVLHQESCRCVPVPIGTRYKRVEAMGRDGGWFSVTSPEVA
ncbi:hypothetical protein CKY51_03575 [Xanthomonas maliensis]|nr:hypothetical protein CKY51_03575 [Xanthomonas maliensis]